MRKFYKNKNIVVAMSFILLVLVSMFVIDDTKILVVNPPQELNYLSTAELFELSEIYLIDKNNYVSRTVIVHNKTDNKIQLATKLLNVLIIGDKGEDLIPSGFRAIIPSETVIEDMVIEGDIIHVDLSETFYEYNIDYERSIIEAIVYTLTSIEGINKVNLKVGSDPVTKLVKNNTILPSILDRSIGINQTFDIATIQNIKAVTIYFIGSHDEATYYVPVTKYMNNKDDKVKIIIEELKSGPLYGSNLLSFINSELVLEDYDIENANLKLYFNDYIYSTIDKEKILEEVLYSISLSLLEIENINEVTFIVGNENIKTVSTFY